MRRHGWPLLVLACMASLVAPASATAATKREKPKVEKYGEGPAYKSLARLPVLHSGRIKPIDTMAREEIKQIYGREKVWLLDANDDFVASWEPVAAMVDWWVRPDFWNHQPIIKVEYLPLKRAMLADANREALEEIAAKSTTSEADRAELEKLAKLDAVDAESLGTFLRTTRLGEADKLDVSRLHARLGEAHKWLTPEEIKAATIKVDGKVITFAAWVDQVSDKRGEIEQSIVVSDKALTELERRGYEVGMAYGRYQVLRDHELNRMLPISILPRPTNEAYIAHTGEVMKRLQHGDRDAKVSPFETESADLLSRYLGELPKKDWEVPGTNSAFDARYAGWLRDKSWWVPMAIVLETDEAELTKSGFPASELATFRSAFGAFLKAEKASPGRIDAAPADSLVAAARELGVRLNPKSYPTETSVDREVGFNRSAPFLWAPLVYGIGAVLLVLSLTVQSTRSSLVRSIHKTLYVGGIAGFVGGIGLEAYGFSQRVLISGWAPVTNMYETVIWVALITSVIGLALEAIYRKTFAALAAAGIATFATAIAATVPLLDPSIKGLQPVLRSNLWLGIHVLTIVSSYAAFALAMGLGMIATWYYLTATYRRSVSYVRLASPVAVGLPVLLIGCLLRGESLGTFSLSKSIVDIGFWPGIALTGLGLIASLAPLFAIVGELFDRTFHADAHASSSKPARYQELAGGMPDPRELVAAGGPLPPMSGGSPAAAFADPRTLAMRETAEKIKPLSNFIYRSMQVGVVLVTLGTILGGVWADYSWGRFWGWDPKEVWALITLLVYLVPLHGRFAGWVNTFGLVVASVVCFLSVLIAWYGVNFLLGVGLHSYGFVEGGSQGVVGLATMIGLSFPAAAAWRRGLSQKPAVA